MPCKAQVVVSALLLAASFVAAQDVATGTFTVGGKAVAMKHAYAREIADTFAKGKTGYEVTLSDVPLEPKDYNKHEKVKAGKLHYIELTIGADRTVYGGMFYHEALGGFVSIAGVHAFDVKTFGPTVVAGKLYTKKPYESGTTKTTIAYSVEFTASVKKKEGGR